MDLLCNKCNQTKPVTDFFKESQSIRGYRYSCKECEKPRFKKYREENREAVNNRRLNWNRKVNFNFPPELFNTRFEEQGNACAICKSTTAGGRGKFHADHDHETNQPRGVLCHNCNIALGNFQDNPEILAAAIEYLKKYLEEK
jgi:hypothetical protein